MDEQEAKKEIAQAKKELLEAKTRLIELNAKLVELQNRKPKTTVIVKEVEVPSKKKKW